MDALSIYAPKNQKSNVNKTLLKPLKQKSPVMKS